MPVFTHLILLPKASQTASTCDRFAINLLALKQLELLTVGRGKNGGGIDQAQNPSRDRHSAQKRPLDPVPKAPIPAGTNHSLCVK